MTSTNDHDDVAKDGERGDGPGGGAAGRRFADRDGRWWDVTWRSPSADPGGPAFGSYVFRAVEGGTQHVIAASSRSGARLAQMSLADVRQLLALARAERPER